MSDWALWLKSFHIIAFAAWMAAMWYLPRLLVNHVAAVPGGEAARAFEGMERRLLKVIATPAMIVTILLGIVLATLQDQWTDGWLHVKLVLVLALGACHGIMASHVRKFAAGERPRSAGWYRAFNEVPTILFVGIVLLAVLKPW